MQYAAAMLVFQSKRTVLLDWNTNMAAVYCNFAQLTRIAQWNTNMAAMAFVELVPGECMKTMVQTLWESFTDVQCVIKKRLPFEVKR